MWGAIVKNGRLHLICMEGSINADSYVDMLENDFFSEVNESLPDDFIWMHDNAPPHVVQKTKGYLERKGINTMEWPPMSPDLNPIENIWSMMKDEVYKKKKVKIPLSCGKQSWLLGMLYQLNPFRLFMSQFHVIL